MRLAEKQILHTPQLKQLLRNKLIIEKITIKGNRKFPIYFANIDEKKYKNYKITYNIQSIIEIELIKKIQDKLMPKSIVLFGSYCRGEDIENSDIDLFIECKKDKINLEKFEKKLNRKIQLHFNENFNNFPKELKNNITNGFTLSGFLKGFK